MIVNFKQQRIMKPIYNVWILLFCLTFSSCYNEDIINPTPDPLALAGGFEFPQGNNSWDNDVMKIYQDFGVKIIYKDITEKDIHGKYENGILMLDIPKKAPEKKVEEKKFVTIEG